MRLKRLILFFLSAFAAPLFSLAINDSIPSGFKLKPEWRVGATIGADYVIGTDDFLRGANVEGANIDASFNGNLNAGFAFNPQTREGMLYKGVYQGVGLGMRTFFHKSLMGNPGSAYVFQGAPFANFGSKWHLGYEWKFGVAFGWHHTDDDPIVISSVISTAVTAHMGVAIKLQYDLSDNFILSAAIEGTHFSNGNTSWRNAGLNSVGASLGVAYVINPQKTSFSTPIALAEEADRKRWFYDIMVFGAFRKRVVILPSSIYTDNLYRKDVITPGRYPVIGMQFAPSIVLNRWVAVGPALDVQWDKSADLSEYWIPKPVEEGLYFSHVPFGKQISVGLSAHAELTAPIFSVNAGIGYNIVNPKGDRAFYQSLTIKTFVTRNIYLNIGYRLGAFKDPNHLMLGVGYRFL